MGLPLDDPTLSHTSVAPNTSDAADKQAKKDAKKARKLARRAERATAEETGDAAAKMTGEDESEIKVDTPANGEEEKLSKEERKRIKKEKKRKAREEEEEAPANAEQSETSAPVAAAEEPIDEPAKKKSKKNKKSSSEPTLSAAPSTGPAVASSSSSSDIDSFLSANRITFEPTNAKDLYPPVLSFAALPIEDGLRKGLSGYAKPTPIQSASFPVMMGGRDVVGIAETGSGKTVAFGVPAIQHILSLPPHPASKGKKSSPPPVSVLVVAPTRELAMQTHANLASVTSALPSITSVCIYGGVPKDSQKAILRTGARIVVGTPGRLLDLANEGVLDLGHVSWLVLDEADRMLDKGFENDIREIIAKCLPLPEASLPKIAGAGQGQEPKARMASSFVQTCMFSATWPTSVRRLASDFMCSPIRITVGNDELTANVRVSQSVIVLPDSRQKEQRLLSVLSQHGFTKGGVKKGGAIGKDREKALIFALYKKEATRVMEFLERQGYEVGCIQGDMTQERRTKSLADFKDGRVQLLVATDVAARGLDIPKVELVVNQTFPLTIEDYIHRIGRTGRAGRTGISVTFFTEADKAHAGELIRVLKDGGHEVPEGMYQWGTTIKKQTHSTYGDFYRDDIKGTSKKIRFD
ncbi:BZ3500_MvSof-1268-A1-R1_Chr1-1g00876 [Microbotryum saponariae]|uniref:RNA helicase n=1 Tax=Microbotryum saponariae TaxID=289078 RepID=A0A2X0KC09_9BASI|nr:BZ3500_MvSof-1268-A1-R1_Chr1-1g00876 [Microbotryum saponariae]SCZ92829.1 BZ3501_MvSof-1269-A2-R1_Chr1-1g00473 [Microbotryum saponariae]